MPTIELINAAGRCPPEDCGSSIGYAEMLEILADPDNEEYEETFEWAGGSFNPADADQPVRAASVDRLAKR